MSKIKLSQVYEALDIMSSCSCSFINLSANEIVTIYNFDDEEYKEEIQLEIDNNRDNYLKLPEQYETLCFLRDL